ncbi:hemerythrin domain-containing protein [Hydrogenophaga sp.]|uniref:hemerythrin domain-containing protein n=1 Tax=Hydrogenophaga sp. TaxID=1904254 RepID=UPI0035637DE7
MKVRVSALPQKPRNLPGYHAPGAGFEAPFEMLAACHERVERMLTLIVKLQQHLQQKGFDDSAAQAARDVMRYFDLAAPLHHEDEERHVFPALMAGPDASIKALVLRLIQDHRQMGVAWVGAKAVLQVVADASPASWRPLTAWQSAALNGFAGLYRQHLDDEDQLVYPAAQVQLTETALAAMGEDMMQRRGVKPTGPV